MQVLGLGVVLEVLVPEGKTPEGQEHRLHHPIRPRPHQFVAALRAESVLLVLIVMALGALKQWRRQLVAALRAESVLLVLILMALGALKQSRRQLMQD